MNASLQRAIESRKNEAANLVKSNTKDLVDKIKGNINFQLGEITSKCENIADIINAAADIALDNECINVNKFNKDIKKHVKESICSAVDKAFN